MEHFGEMLLRLKARSRRDIDERKTAFREHGPRELQPFGRQEEVGRMTGCILESSREMRRAHVHQRGELLDLNVLGNVLVDEVFNDSKPVLCQAGARVLRAGIATIAAGEMQCDNIGEGSQAHIVRTLASIQRGESIGGFAQEGIPGLDPAWDFAGCRPECLSRGFAKLV